MAKGKWFVVSAKGTTERETIFARNKRNAAEWGYCYLRWGHITDPEIHVWTEDEWKQGKGPTRYPVNEYWELCRANRVPLLEGA